MIIIKTGSVRIHNSISTSIKELLTHSAGQERLSKSSRVIISFPRLLKRVTSHEIY